jgi:thiamine pyrophosphate-dependent acetolactate synthase large subunit-like protein
MRSRGLRAGAVCVLAALLVAAPAAAAPELSMSRAVVSTRIGADFRFQTTIANLGPAPMEGLIAHLDVVSRDPSVYVDPEDWSPERTRYLARLEPGAAIDVPWTVKAVNSGRFSVYVVVLGAGGPVAGPALDARVTERRTLDAGGVLPLALGLPALLGAALLGLRARRPR